jgi:hypothetical protein
MNAPTPTNGNQSLPLALDRVAELDSTPPVVKSTAPKIGGVRDLWDERLADAEAVQQLLTRPTLIERFSAYSGTA